MKFDYGVKHNGVFYPAGADVPVGEPTPKKVSEEPKKEEVKVEKPAPKPTAKKK